MACGHYSLPFHESVQTCAQASERYEEFRTERVPCDALIYELEINRTDGWGWTCEVDGQLVQVVVDSSGHCDAWRVEGYQKPDYLKLAASAKPTTVEDSGIDSSTASTGASTDGDLKINGTGSKKENLWGLVKGLVR